MNLFNAMSNSYAKDVAVGDEVLVQQNNEMIPAKVVKVVSGKMQGM